MKQINRWLGPVARDCIHSHSSTILYLLLPRIEWDMAGRRRNATRKIEKKQTAMRMNEVNQKSLTQMTIRWGEKYLDNIWSRSQWAITFCFDFYLFETIENG